MKALSIRNLPDEIYDGLKTMAALNRRSMQEQARSIIEREVRLTKSPSAGVAREWRLRFAGRVFSPVVNDVQQGRVR